MRDAIEKVHSVKDSQWPEFNVSDIRPMDRSMMQHGARDGHDCGYSSLSQTIGVMGANSRVTDSLMELFKVSIEIFIDKGCSVVAEVLLDHYASGGAHRFELFLGFQGLMGIEMGLKFDVDVPGGVIDEDATTGVFLVVGFFPIGVQSASVRLAVEMVDRDLLTRKHAILFKLTGLGLGGPFCAAWGCLASLLGILASSTQWSRVEFRGCSLSTFGLFSVGKIATLEHPLDSTDGDVAQSVVPTQKFLLRSREIEVGSLC
jgi:hypothetical protein